MSVSTTDVCTNVVQDNTLIKNATTVVSCQRTGNFQTLDSFFEKSFTYDQLESKYTSRFDNITYYVKGPE
jgi:hypothetical protein